MISAVGYSRETSEGYEKATTIGGHPAVEKWNAGDKNGELTAVRRRSLHRPIDGHTCERVKTLRDFAGKIDFGKMAAMK